VIAALLAAVLVVTGAIHWYLWKRLVKDTNPATPPGPGSSARCSSRLLALVIPSRHPSPLFPRAPHCRTPRQALVAWPGFPLARASWFYLLVDAC